MARASFYSILLLTRGQIGVATFGPARLPPEREEGLGRPRPLQQQDVTPAHLVQAEQPDLALRRGLQGQLVGAQGAGEVGLKRRAGTNKFSMWGGDRGRD